MKKYTKPVVQVVELSVKESLSAIPFKFQGMAQANIGLNDARFKNISIYTKTSAPAVQG